MPVSSDLVTARDILGPDVLGPEEVHAALAVPAVAVPIPYTVAELEGAAAADEALILHVDRDATGPLTLLRLIERFPACFDARFLRKMGYQLKDDWGIALEPRAGTDTCAPGWLLVRKTILDPTRNLAYDGQNAQLAQYAQQLNVSSSSVRRRTAIEIVYDLIVYHAARGERLLAEAWDWSTTGTLDAGYLNVGGFGASGMQILSYSSAVRHGALGVCPVRTPRADA
jgi:hypothetical protein